MNSFILTNQSIYYNLKGYKIEEKALYKQLDTGLWITAGSRFLSHKKYKSIYNSFVIVSVLLTFSLICISILNLNNLQITIVTEKSMNTSILIISIFLFSLSIYMPLLSTKVRLLHENATKINGLLRKLKLAKNDKDLERILDLYNDYELQLNHDTIDYNRWCDTIKNDKYNHNSLEKYYFLLVWYSYAKFIYIIAILSVITLILTV